MKLLRSINTKYLVSSLVAVLVIGCAADARPVYRFTEEPPGSRCQYGGLKIEYGDDSNGNGILDNSEASPTQTTYACAILAEGKTAKVSVTVEPPGAHCSNGGFKIQSGLDLNSNNVLDPSEVEGAPAYICNGTNGTNGTNGRNSLIRLSVAPSDPAQCTFGGTKIDSGIDTNLDGTLQNTEVQNTQFVCSIKVIDNVIVESKPLNPGVNPSCPNGGVRITAGVDLNGDRILQPGEVSGTSDMCNQIQVVAGKTSLIVTNVATAQQCQFGGYVMQSGLDNNYDNILQAGEVTATNLVCNGANGFNSLVRTTAVSAAAGSACEFRGGIRYESGLDSNRNNTLDTAEVTRTDHICNGYTGPEGTPSLIRQTAAGAGSPCGANGGVSIQTGADDNLNGVLDALEVSYTSYVCNGANALVSAVVLVPGTARCSGFGGYQYNMGTDFDGDDFLDNGEITSSQDVCNGIDGTLVDIESTPEGGICEFGGAVVYTGFDTNGNTVLDTAERESTTYLCVP